MTDQFSALDELELDADQERAKTAMERYIAISQNHGEQTLWQKIFGPKMNKAVHKGLYLYGPSGRGKTVLMDWFFDNLDTKRKKRVHFHEFMIDVHDALHDARDDAKDDIKDTRVERLAQHMAKDFDILCFDEFHVTDVADAMILHPLIKGFVDAGVFIVLTTNWAPKRLYEDGLQRERFIPFITFLQHEFEILPFLNGPDYRQQFKNNAPRWLLPLNKDTKGQFDHIVQILTKGERPKDMVIKMFGGREERFLMANGMALLEADRFLSRDLGARDFLHLAKELRAVFLDEIKPFEKGNNEQAKRFMTLIDVLYEAETPLFIRADCQPEELYGGGRLKYEFQRTISRLYEMRQMTGI